MTDDPPVAYDVAYEWDESHGRLVKLLSGRAGRGVILDLGCGYAPHAEPMRDAGFTYVGFDLDDASVDAVRRRGFAAHVLDLTDQDEVIATLDRVVAETDKPVVGLIALDVIEHLVEPHLLLDRVSTWLGDHPQAVLGVSVPNVAYRDLAVKLLGGRWDVTPTGLVDHTHLRFFTDRSLDAMMCSASFAEIARDDRPAPRSDQHWPTGSPLLSASARLGAFLRGVRESVDRHSATYQFVRLYAPARRADTSPTIIAERPKAPTVFLSVLADPSCSDRDIDAIRVQLSTQTSDDWELLTATHDAAGVPPLDATAASARGAYLCVLGPGDVVGPMWVEQFAAVASEPDDQMSAAILRCRCPDDPDTRGADVRGSDALGSAVLDHELGDLGATGPTHAFPAAAVSTFGFGFGDGTLPPALSLLLDAFQVCGIVDTGFAAVVEAGPVRVDHGALRRRLDEIDRRPVLMSPGTLQRIDGSDRSDAEVSQRVSRLEGEIELLRRDNEWLNRELSQVPVRAVRRLLRRGPSRT